MPRKERIFRQNTLHHVMLRGVNGENIFRTDMDYTHFSSLLQEACESFGLVVHAFCLMTNHVHLLLEPLTSLFSEGIHSFSFRYAKYFNYTYERYGHLFQGRFKSIIVEDGTYLRRLTRYIHLNPVEAKIVSRPENFKWSSYRAYLGQDHYEWLITDRVLRSFGDSKASAVEYFVEHTHNKLDVEVDFSNISEAFRKGVFGSDVFAREFGILKNDDFGHFLPSSLDEMIDYVCNYFNVTIEELAGQNKNRSVVDARSVLALITRQMNKWSFNHLGTLLNKSSGTLSNLASRAEQQPRLIEIINSWDRV